MKAPRACRPCREGKRKCTRQALRVGDPCHACQRRKIHCTGIKPAPRTSPASLLPGPGPSSRETEKGQNVNTDELGSRSVFHSRQGGRGVEEGIEIDLDTALQLIDYYLRKVHDRSHSLFHPTLLREKVRSGSLSRTLLLALCSMGSRFSQDEGIRGLEMKLMNEAKALLLSDIENICVENVQTCIILANLCAAHMNPSSEALFFRTFPISPPYITLRSRGQYLQCFSTSS